MKNSLKIFPDCTKCKVEPCEGDPCFCIEKWLEEFEKRQRDNLASYAKALERKNESDEFRACWQAISNYIHLEVLGE